MTLGGISVVIPVFNNRESLSQLHSRLVEALDSLSEPYEILFVDDGSTDGSHDILQRLSAESGATIHIGLSRNFGQHPAIHAGLSHAKGQLLVLMDADLQDDPNEIPGLVRHLVRTDADIVFTSYENSTALRRRRLSSVLFHRLFSRLAHAKAPRNFGTFRVFKRVVRDALLDYPERSAVYGPLMLEIGFSSTTVPVTRLEPVGRRSSYGLRRRLSLAVNSLLYYGSSLPMVVFLIGALVAVGALLYLIVVVISFAVGGRSLPPGSTLVLSIALLTSGVTLLSLGVLALYTLQTFREVLSRPRYHVRSVSPGGLRVDE